MNMGEPCHVVTANDVVTALDSITHGRVVRSGRDISGNNPFVVTKSSHLPGKAVTEMPGLVWGDPCKVVRKIGVGMTLTENVIELAAAMGMDALLLHHPLADGASSGGVTLRNYMDLYDMALFELHEAFHGLHPGISWLHGHKVRHVQIAYGGVPGNIMFVGTPLEGVRTLGDVCRRLGSCMGSVEHHEVLRAVREIRKCPCIEDSCVAGNPLILEGTPESPLKEILHIFPHTGFSAENLESALKEHPGVNTVIASISRMREASPLVEKARELGLYILCGNTHAMEIYENGMPLAFALKSILPALDVRIFQEKTICCPLESFGSSGLREYARTMADTYLLARCKLQVQRG
jgi:hypothetical protein